MRVALRFASAAAEHTGRRRQPLAHIVGPPDTQQWAGVETDAPKAEAEAEANALPGGPKHVFDITGAPPEVWSDAEAARKKDALLSLLRDDKGDLDSGAGLGVEPREPRPLVAAAASGGRR